MKRRIFGIYPQIKKNNDWYFKKVQIINEKWGFHFKDFFSSNMLCMGSVSNNKNVVSRKNKVVIDGYISNKKEISNKYNLSFENDQDFLMKFYKLEPRNWNKHLKGSYSICLYDIKKDILHLVRDNCGQKPLFYFHKKNNFVFGSEIKFIQSLLDKQPKVNLKKVSHFLCQYRENSYETFFEDIYAVEPGQMVTFNGKEVHKEKVKRKIHPYNANELSAKRDLEQHILKSVERCLEKDKNPAFMISGGLDSAAIYTFAKDLKEDDINTISMNFKKNGNYLKCDEGIYQDRLLKKTTCHEKVLIKSSPMHNINLWLERYDQPFLLPNAYLYEEVYKRAKSKKFTTIIDGSGGDAVFSHGWERFKELFKLKTIFTFYKELKLFNKNHDYGQYTRSSLSRKFTLSLLRNTKLFSPLFKIKDFLTNKQLDRPRILKDEYLALFKIKDNYNFYRNFRAHKKKVYNTIGEASLSSLDILFFKYDIQNKHPLFDEDLIDLCISFPSKFKLNAGRSRYLIREILKNKAPEDITERFSKSNLSESFQSSFFEYDILKIEQEINNPHKIIKKLLNKENLLLFKKA